MVFSSSLPASHPFPPIIAKFLLKETKVLLSNNPFSLSDIQASEHSSANPCNLTDWCQWKCMTCWLCWVLRAAQPCFFCLIRSLWSFGSAVISIMHTLLLTSLMPLPTVFLLLVHDSSGYSTWKLQLSILNIHPFDPLVWISFIFCLLHLFQLYDPQISILIIIFFWLHSTAYKILVPWPWIESKPLTVKAQSPNHWTVKEFSILVYITAAS